MKNYTSPRKENWSGRTSKDQQYLHEKVEFISIPNEAEKTAANSFGILGYACDEGVERNNGRIGAKHGPDYIKKMLGPMPNHIPSKKRFYDFGNIECIDNNLKETQDSLSQAVHLILKQKCFPIVLGGGHDIAYGHYNGIQSFLGKDKKIGIINFDAHFDLRSNENGSNSGTPFYQIAKECEHLGTPFNYLCLGIRKDANPKILFNTAKKFGVGYIKSDDFILQNFKKIKKRINTFIRTLDAVYVTIDLDGFSSASAPGVSAASPMGFSPTIVLKCLKHIIKSNKIVGMDLAEFNPKYDRDNQTAKLAASIIHFITSNLD